MKAKKIMELKDEWGNRMGVLLVRWTKWWIGGGEKHYAHKINAPMLAAATPSYH